MAKQNKIMTNLELRLQDKKDMAEELKKPEFRDEPKLVSEKSLSKMIVDAMCCRGEYEMVSASGWVYDHFGSFWILVNKPLWDKIRKNDWIPHFYAFPGVDSRNLFKRYCYDQRKHKYRTTSFASYCGRIEFTGNVLIQK